MSRILQPVLLLSAGFLAGWWLRDALAPAPPHREPPPPPEVFERVLPELPMPAPAPAQALTAPEQRTAPRVPAREFRRLLERGRFEAAVLFYQESAARDDADHGQLRPVFDDFIGRCLARCEQGDFVDLVDAWLAAYYDDIPVMLSLAEYQRQLGYYEEAVQVLNMAATYAYTPGRREAVTAALRELVEAADRAYSARQEWIALLGFYEFVAALALEEPAFGLRRASLYLTLGETERAREVLQSLQAGGETLDEDLSRAVADQLAALAPVAAPEPAPADAIPLQRRGDHFLVTARLNGREQLLLMIDTGASVTALSREAFERLDDRGLEYVGSRMFNTAGGLARGEVYRASELALGDARLGNVPLAVLDYASDRGVDGLLGMNVLRNFRFEIDQDRELLYLRPRPD